MTLSSQLLSRGWGPLLTKVTPPTKILINEFYSNIQNITGFTSFSVYIRGNIIDITPQSLAKSLGIPFVERLIFPCSANNCPPMTTIASFRAKRTIRKITSKEFPSTFFAPKYLMASRFISTNTFPNKHLSAISFERMRFICFSLQGFYRFGHQYLQTHAQDL